MLNIKPRQVVCHGKHRNTHVRYTNDPQPRCGECGAVMITVVYSPLDGQPITGLSNSTHYREATT